MRRTLIAALVLLCVALLAVSCRNSVDEGRASLSLRIESGDTSRTIMPSQALMDVQKYTIMGKGPSGATFGPVLSTDSEVSIDDLAIGGWTITARALNAQNNELAQGEGTFQISRGSNAGTIVLDTITGTGSLQLDFVWGPGICKDSMIRININIEDSHGNVVSRSRDVPSSECKATVVVNLDAGSHVLNIRVQDMSGNVGLGATEAVRIVANTRSTGTVDLKTSSPMGTGGGTTVNIRNDIGTPMNFYIDYNPKNPGVNQFITLYARCAALPEGVSESDLFFQWYRDGVLMSPASGNNISFLTEAGMRRYDVIVRSNKEGTMCGASLLLNVSD